MRVVLVDDERLALIQLKMMLEEVGNIEVIGTYSNPEQAVDMCKKLCPDAVFLDIQMPEIDGLMAGMLIQESLPEVELVFVTAYDEYAVNAFEINALDYIMKPLQKSRLEKTISRIMERLELQPVELSGEKAMLCAFEQIGYRFPGQEMETIKWRTTKARELFAYLFHHRGRTVDKDTIMELLWPGIDPAKGSTQLYTTIYLIRKSLKLCGLERMISINSGNLVDGYTMTIESIVVDAEVWEEQLKALLPPGHRTINEHERVLQLYTGDYMAAYGYLWVEHERERMRRLWLHHAQDLASFYVQADQLDEAIRVNLRIQQIHPDEEDTYLQLMRLYDLTHNRLAVEEQYWLLCARLKQELDSEPCDEISNWYAAWRENVQASG